MKRAIGVLLSGNSTIYYYSADEKDLVNRSAGDKVVIPNKVKDDGTLSMSIGSYIHNASDVAVEGLKPVVMFIDMDAVRTAQLEVLKLEAK